MKIYLHEGHHDSDGHHDHKHTHDGAEHSHEEVNLHDSAKDMATLKALVKHWIHHGEDHVGSYEEWVEKARAHGKEDVANALEEAIGLLNKANEAFRKAQDLM